MVATGAGDFFSQVALVKSVAELAIIKVRAILANLAFRTFPMKSNAGIEMV